MKTITLCILPVLFIVLLQFYPIEQKQIPQHKYPIIQPVKYKEKGQETPNPSVSSDTIQKNDSLKVHSMPQMNYKLFKKTLYLHRNILVS